jgi:hypothetical protein
VDAEFSSLFFRCVFAVAAVAVVVVVRVLVGAYLSGFDSFPELNNGGLVCS